MTPFFYEREIFYKYRPNAGSPERRHGLGKKDAVFRLGHDAKICCSREASCQ
jgi:hypothetical protein